VRALSFGAVVRCPADS